MTVFLLTSCNNKTDIKIQNRNALSVKKIDTLKDLKNEPICGFTKPDTSLLNINLRDIASAEIILNGSDKLDKNEYYHFYSILDNETLSLKQHPGDGKYQISIFKVEKSDKAYYGYRNLNIKNFETGKGIKLGMTKNKIIEILGNCFETIDSTKTYTELYYEIQTPNDTKTKYLERQNMPTYFASYKFCYNKLVKFEFGFEYP